MKIKNTFEQDWREAFDSFHKLSRDVQQILRRCAAEHLVARGAEEVGSSDISHELFAMWKMSGRNWQQVVQEEFELFAQSN